MELPDACDVVIIGAGIAGCSSAYHLSQSGQDNIVLLEQGPLWSTGGSTSHAPGGIADGDLRSQTMSDFCETSRVLYAELGVFQPAPQLKVARTQTQLEELRRDVAQWQREGRQDVRMISPEDARWLHPMIEPGQILGAMFVPAKYVGRADAIAAVEALAGRARTAGVRFFDMVRVEGIVQSGAAVTAVKVLGMKGSKTIHCKHAVICAGAWSGAVASAAAGIRLPVMAVQHPYRVSGSIPELREYSPGPNGWADTKRMHPHQSFQTVLPSIWDPDTGIYVQQFGDHLGFGTYGHPASVLACTEVAKRTALGVQEPVRFPSPEAEFWQGSLSQLEALLPAVKRSGYKVVFNGLMTYAPDGYPVVGPHPNIKGLWFCCCTYLWHAGGAGSLLAEWLAHGRPSQGAAWVDCVDPKRLWPQGDLHEWVTDDGLKACVARVYESRMSDHREMWSKL